jgi:hypothetical protein
LTCSAYIPERELENMKLPIRTFTEVADCSKENTPHPYNLHPSATACTKAAGRVYKSILQLSCHTAEEMSLETESAKVVEDISVPNDMESSSISKVQQTIITTLADRLGIDIEKALQFHSLNTDIKQLTRAEAASFIVVLNKYQSDVADASMQVPDFIKSI